MKKGGVGAHSRPLLAPGEINAAVNWDRSYSFAPYAAGYWLVAEAIVEKISEDGHIGHDAVIFPLLFIYRQAIELELKHLIVDLAPLLDRPSHTPHGHDLIRLWRDCEAMIIEIDPSAAPDLASSRETIFELAQADHLGETFRYPLSKDGKPLLPPELTLIDVPSLAAQMERVRQLLDGVSMMSQAYREARDEERHWLTERE